jgi:hypothetical protein
MNDDEIARRVKAARDAAQGAEDPEEARARTYIERARATGRRLEVVEDADGTELRVRPLTLSQRMRNEGAGDCLVACVLLLLSHFLLFLPVAGALWAALRYLPSYSTPAWGVAAGLYLVSLTIYVRYMLRSPRPLRLRVTSQGHAAFWTGGDAPDNPTWVGEVGSGVFHVEAFPRRKPKGLYGWNSLFGWAKITLNTNPPTDGGNAYHLNVDDATEARRFLAQHGLGRG